MQKIKLKNGKYTLVDKENFEFLNQFKWDQNEKGYVVRSYSSKTNIRTRRLSRMVMNIDNTKIIVDHINHDLLDNRKQNLRLVDEFQSMYNIRSHKNSTSKYKGVSYIKRDGSWKAKIKCKEITLIKYFKNEIEAANQYNIWADQLHGKYAYKNII